MATPFQVLVVDDNPINRQVMGKLLEKHHCAISFAQNGVEAVQLASAVAFDLIVMDCHMPMMDGLEATQYIRTQEEGTGRHTPIVALSAYDGAPNREACKQAGMDDFFAKPVSQATVLAMLDYLPSASQVEALPSDPPSASNPTALKHPMAQHLESLGLSIELVVDAGKMLLEQLAGRVALLELAFASENLAEIASNAHSLKGAVGTFTAGTLYQALQNIEQGARHHEDWLALADEWDRVLSSLEPFEHDLAQLLEGVHG